MMVISTTQGAKRQSSRIYIQCSMASAVIVKRRLIKEAMDRL
jgi:hypothetical protein